jgi:hypothetical protein
MLNLLYNTQIINIILNSTIEVIELISLILNMNPNFIMNLFYNTQIINIILNSTIEILELISLILNMNANCNILFILILWFLDCINGIALLCIILLFCFLIALTVSVLLFYAIFSAPKQEIVHVFHFLESTNIIQTTQL